MISPKTFYLKGTERNFPTMKNSYCRSSSLRKGWKAKEISCHWMAVMELCGRSFLPLISYS